MFHFFTLIHTRQIVQLFLIGLFIVFSYQNGFSQNLDSLKTAVFPDDGLAPFETSPLTFTKDYLPSNSFWASPFPESTVYHSLLKYEHPTDPNHSFEIRVGKGGNIYSFIGSFGESVPPQYPAIAPWVDEVWQMVAVDGALNNPPNEKHFIHQAGVYLKTPEQSQPFFSPIVAEYFDEENQSYTVVNWGQQAHTSDNLITGYTSSILYYTQYKNLGNGVIQMDYLMYNFGTDVISFINIPWGGVRRSTFDHWFATLPDHTYYEETGNFTSYTELLSNTGGWAAFSSDPLGDAPSLALLMDNDEGTLRLGDAGTIANRDYTVFEGIKFPGTDLSFGKAIRARNFYLLDSDLDSIQATIIDQNLGNETFYGPFNKVSTEVDSTAYGFEYQGDELVAVETTFTEGLNLKLRPFLNSYPVFIIKGTDGSFRVTTDLYTMSSRPYDGMLDSIQLLGYTDNPTQIHMETALICSGTDYTFPDGTTLSNITSPTRHFSDMGLAVNGYDSLLHTLVYVEPNQIPTTDFLPNGPGGVGSTNGASSLSLWLDASNPLGKDTSNPMDGSSMDTWKDLSGYEDHYQATGLNRPTFSNSSAFSSVHFDASAVDPQFMVSSDSSSQAYGSIFIGLNAIDGGSSNALIGNAELSVKYEQVPNSGFLGYSELGMLDYTSSLPSVFGVDHLISFQVDCTDNLLRIASGSTTESLPVGSNNNGIPLGSLGSTSERASGDFYEIIAYKSPLNVAQKILVDNYMSAKYGGINISNNLYDEDEIANGDFDFDVAGIGRTDSDNFHDNSRGTGIIQVNNPADLGDGEFFFWGDNGQALDFSIDTDLPTYIIGRTPKIWAVSEVNLSLNPVDVGLVDLTFDLSDLLISDFNQVALIIDRNKNGNFADETLIRSSALSTLDYEGQALAQFQAVDLQDGMHFCLGRIAPNAPGGVYENLRLWLKTDGTIHTLPGTEVTQWTDQSENKYLANGTGPVINSSINSMLNFNPVVSFDGIDDLFTISDGIVGTGTYSDINIFLVHRLNSVPHQSTIIRESVVGGGISSHLPWDNGRVFWDAGISSGDGRINTLSGLSAGDDAFWQLSSHNGVSDLQYIRKDGLTLNADNTAISITGSSSNLHIGSAGGGLFSNGDLAEVIVYLGNAELNSLDLQRIESYLAIKYGYTLNQTLGGSNGDYINSNNTLIWDADNNSDYHNDVIGIAMDQGSLLNQKQSHTKDDSLAIYLGTLALDNEQNSSNFSNDLSSILIGHNQGQLYDPAPSNNLEQPLGIFSRFEREWKITNHQFSDNFSLKIEWPEIGNFDINDIRLLVDEDGDFSNAQIVGSPEVSFAEGSIIVSGISPSIIPTNSTRYITIASIRASTPLPVELVSFTAFAKNKVVQLEWSTQSETQNDFFTIERSIDGLRWTAIKQIDGAINSMHTIHYKAVDEQPLSGLSYYRLKQTDFDRSSTYSIIRAIDFDEGKPRIRVYPNPTTRLLYLEGDEAELESWQIFNILGQDMSNHIRVSKAGTIWVLDLSPLEIGTYTLKTKHETFLLYRE